MKRKRKTQTAECAVKKPKTTANSVSHHTAALLRQYYPRVSTLREYLVSRLLKGSKQRSRELLRYGDGIHGMDADAAVVWLLDRTLVGSFDQTSAMDYDSIDRDITLFTQQLTECTDIIGPTQGAFQQSETVNFVIWSLFQRQHTWRRPAHILCHGYQRTTTPGDGGELDIVPGIPGILISCTNPHVQTLKEHPWKVLPSLLGRQAELIISGMLLEAGVFTQIDGSSNMIQLSGTPMSDLKSQAAKPPDGEALSREPLRNTSKGGRNLNEIRFVRHRMLYARPSLTSNGQARIGPNHLHVLNRLRKTDDDNETVQVTKYLFPRQFGLHNVFTSDVDPADTALQFKDYTLREKEIAAAEQRSKRTFHVTESNVHRNQLFYFRHDDWKAMTEPALSSLKAGMLEECSAATVRKMLAKRALGVSQVRLLPKESGMRPIINLRRRVQSLQHGQMVLGRSINSLLTPAFSVLNYEKNARPEMLGSALFSVDDIFPRLQTFKETLLQHGHGSSPLYFAKVDVQSCFDTIPQERLMSLARTIVRDDSYRVAKYARAKLVGGLNEETPGFGAKPSWKFLTKASASGRPFSFADETAVDTREGRSRTVYVDRVIQKAESRKAILDLLVEHVQANLIRIGKRYYRQKQGIPQGSIVSSLLCSYIYAELERDVLGFLTEGQTLLLRLIDDFLVISTDRSVAERFMQVMHAGSPAYGVQVKAEKSRANFDILVRGNVITRLPQQSDFAYCGNAINTVTLDLSKDHERRRRTNNTIADSVTVDFSKLPGQNFYRKTLAALKLQMHAMLSSTKYNSVQTVFANLYHSFSEIAQKSYHYMRSLPAGKQPGGRLLIRTLDDVVKLACVLMRRRKRTSKDVLGYECCVSDAQARWLAYTAFHAVFQRRQTKHGELLAWLKAQLVSRELGMQRKLLEPVAKAYRYLPDIPGVTRGIGGYRSLTEPAVEMEKHMASVEERDVVETAPSSPPELSYSKSSKSSNSSPSNSLAGDISTETLSHFEDVTLHGNSRSSVEDCNVKPESRPTLRRPPKRMSTASAEAARHSASPPNAMREKRYPSLQGAVTGVLQDQSLNLPQGGGMRRGFTSPSSPSFMMNGPQRMPSRSPSPRKPISQNESSYSPQLLSSTTPRSSWSGPSPNPNSMLGRRQSWQPGRKTAKQLEAEYDDGDDELPDDAILENVPITPLPGQGRSPRTKTPSPQRKSLHNTLHSANVPKNAKRPSAPTVMPNGQYGAPRSPRHGRPPMLPHSATVASFPPEAFSLKHRSKSWASDLNEEARELSAALEEHAERLSSDKRRSGTNSVASSPPRPSLTTKRAKTTVLELPPVQKGSIMIDPLPISKEKEAVLTRTRPSWLPPKNQKEEKKHVKEWEQMMARAADAEKKRVLRLKEEEETKEEQKTSMARIWEEHVLPNWDTVIAQPHTRELWWRGVTPESRAQVWPRAIGNELQLSHATFEAALRRAEEVEERVAEMPSEERGKSQEAAWFDAIERDVPNAFPELEVFERGTPVHRALTEVLKAYAMYRNDVGYVYGTHLIAATLCLHMRAGDAFVVLANLLSRPLPLAFLIHDKAGMNSAYDLVLSTLKYKCTKLHSHLTSSVTDLQPEEYLAPIFRCLFAYNLPPEHVSRVWDIYAFEGDKVLVRAAVAVLGRLESRLYGSKEEVLELLGWGNGGRWEVGGEEEFVSAVRDAGKVDAKGVVPGA
ncbi:hypothetical protein B0A55_06334 [Friedmanniomyces simplex]|uniref:Telomerase reverse transcriptase n=1 Tax=Friedmanniomyces simplex TaxID=329884 RepID=A0A4U0X614_9PEZI|nr:hypothetical protein B0A55_06334 [Friedmanniomyces simplex]